MAELIGIEPDLVALADRYYAGDGNRKGPNYLAEYARLFEGIREQELKILELGVFAGASLMIWRDYLPRATIVGIDINEMPPAIAGDRRIHFLRGSQDDPAVLDAAVREAGGAFDIIIDDASHIGWLTKRSLGYLFPRWLKPGGWYVIEDIGTAYLPEYPDGRAYQPPPWDDAAAETREYESHRFGLMGLVKQLADHMMQELMTGVRPVLDIDRMTLLVNIAFIHKAERPPLGPPPPMPGAAPQSG